MPYGYNGKVLRVDLTNRSCTVEEPGEAFYRQYLGGSALGLHYILKETPSKADPLGPDNVLTFAVGVATGLPFSGQSRISANAKSPLTGAIGDTQAGGFFPAELKRSGYDAIIIKGKASSPVYLWIKDGVAEIRDASHLWGKTTGEAERLIKEELGDPKIEVKQIGPAGENLVLTANIVNMSNRACGRTGLGAVMGSKNLRAIAVRGSQQPVAADPAGIAAISRWGAQNFKANDSMVGLQKHGTDGGLAGQHFAGGLPTRNWTSGAFPEGYENLTGETMTNTILKERDTCFGCITRCKRVVEIKEGKYQVDPLYGGPEYESVATLGSYCGVNDLAAVAKANERCNALGLDTIGTGATIAWAMDCYEHGLLTKQDTGGLDLRFGNADAVLELIEQIAFRQGFGAILALGAAKAAEKLGKGAEYVASVKGAALPAHMPEVKRSLALIYAVNPFGADHMSHEHDPAYAPDAGEREKSRLAMLGLTNPQETRVLNEEKVRFAYTTQKMYSVTDSLCLCQFDWGPAWTLYGPEHFLPMIKAATGWDMTMDELMRVGERRINMMRAFNAREGFTREQDVLPPKVHQPKVGGASDGVFVTVEELEKAKDLYYQMAGWDVATGNPTPRKLEELGLSWVVSLL